MKSLKLNVVGGNTISFSPNAIINAGRTGRDTESVKAHIEELKKEGINISGEIPIFHPKVRDRIIIEDKFETLPNSKSCGEVEFALIFAGGDIYVGVGSDHTDREFEKENIRVAKQIYPNVLAPEVWKYQEVVDHWDDLVMRSWVKKDGEELKLYQEDVLAELLPPEELIKRVKSDIMSDLNGLIMFGGTFPVIGGELIFSKYFGMEIFDEKLGRSIKHSYITEPIKWIE